MWARRLGVPPLWPSRVKVIFLSVLTSLFVFTAFQYLYTANPEYLRLIHPHNLDIKCRLPPEPCVRAADPVRCMLPRTHKLMMYLDEQPDCPIRPPSVEEQTCHNPLLPLAVFTGHESTLHAAEGGVNPFHVWSIIFLGLMALLSLSILVHDLALLEESLRTEIFTFSDLVQVTPPVRIYFECMVCLKGGRRRPPWQRALAALVWPLWVTVLAAVFMLVVYPFCLAAFLRWPIRMSRMMVFMSSLLCMLWSTLFVLDTLLSYNKRLFALPWGAEVVPTEMSCICFCEFPLRMDVGTRMVTLGLGMLVQSFNLAFRALKGLRRSQWANMFSILYSVPIEAFPVLWERPGEAGGGPVQFRLPGEPVQAEPAFDPFCLMDEQPESAWTRPCLAPVRADDRLLGSPDGYLSSQGFEVGCCGFPHLPQEQSTRAVASRRRLFSRSWSDGGLPELSGLFSRRDAAERLLQV